MEFRILGPLEARHAGRDVPLGGCRQHRLLAALLLRPGQVVAVERLVDVLWDDNPPATAKQQIHSAVSTLRNALAAVTSEQVLVTSTAGYLIDTSHAAIDATLFTERVAGARLRAAHGDTVAAVAGYRSALSLWRGQALTGMSGPVFEPHTACLDESRLIALEECLDSELELGRYDQVVAEVRQLLTQHPFRQRLVRHLMVGLSRAGRTAEALTSFTDFRELVTAQLGLSPGPELRRLQQAILGGEPPTGTAQRGRGAARHTALPADVTPPSCHQDQLAALDRMLTPGGQRIATITGPAGVGKSALAVHWAHRVRGRFPDGYLYVNLRGGRGGAGTSPGSALQLLLQSLNVPRSEMPTDIDEMAGLYRSLLADCRMLVILDNADRVEQVLPLLPGDAACFTVVTGGAALRSLSALHDATSVVLKTDAVALGRLRTRDLA